MSAPQRSLGASSARLAQARDETQRRLGEKLSANEAPRAAVASEMISFFFSVKARFLYAVTVKTVERSEIFTRAPVRALEEDGTRNEKGRF